MLSDEQRLHSDYLRVNLGFGDRRVADALGVSYYTVRNDREQKGAPNQIQLFDEGTMKDYHHLVVIPDTQWPYEHKPSEAALYEYLSKSQPEHLVHIGDALDLTSLAHLRSGPPPARRPHLRAEIENGRMKFRELVALTPDALTRRFIVGNHEERLSRYLEDNAGEIHDLVDDILNLSTLLKIDKDWETIGPYHEGTWAGEPDGLWLTHGDYTAAWSAYSARKHVDKYLCSIAHGHTHRLGAHFRTMFDDTVLVGYEVGTLADPQTTPSNGTVLDWQHGFLDVWLSVDSPRFSATPVAIVEGGFAVQGKHYGS